jgi:hypothetical protein
MIMPGAAMMIILLLMIILLRLILLPYTCRSNGLQAK